MRPWDLGGDLRPGGGGRGDVVVEGNLDVVGAGLGWLRAEPFACWFVALDEDDLRGRVLLLLEEGLQFSVGLLRLGLVVGVGSWRVDVDVGVRAGDGIQVPAHLPIAVEDEELL